MGSPRTPSWLFLPVVSSPGPPQVSPLFRAEGVGWCGQDVVLETLSRSSICLCLLPDWPSVHAAGARPPLTPPLFSICLFAA
uniref:Uncharacterized protein n=1 Tax=Phlebotomus papatasi TaxID=29031 RepID=A0A1B0D1W9_PHLPP